MQGQTCTQKSKPLRVQLLRVGHTRKRYMTETVLHEFPLLFKACMTRPDENNAEMHSLDKRCEVEVKTMTPFIAAETAQT